LYGILGAGMHRAVRGGMIGADGQQRYLRPKALANLAEAVEVCRVAGVIERMPAGFQDVAAVPAMHVAQDARAPMPRRHMRDLKMAEPHLFPPIEFDDAAIS